MIACGNCGHQNVEGDRFCAECGEFLEWAGPSGEVGTEPVPSRGKVVVSLSPHELRADAGEEAFCLVEVANRGTIVDQYHFTVRGEAAAFAHVDPPSVNVYPGETETVRLRIRPPRSSAVRADTLGFEVQACSKESAAFGVARGRIEIGAFTNLGAELVPETSRARHRATHELALTNAGNVKVAGRLSVKDPDQLLRFHLPRPDFTVEPGETFVTPIEVRTRKWLWRGPEQRRPFRTMVHLEGAPFVVDGAFVHRALLPVWFGKAIGGAVALALAVLGLTVLANRPAASTARLQAEQAAAQKELERTGDERPEGQPAAPGAEEGAPAEAAPPTEEETPAGEEPPGQADPPAGGNGSGEGNASVDPGPVATTTSSPGSNTTTSTRESPPAVPVRIPVVTGLGHAQAEAQLIAAGFQVNKVFRPSPLARGRVLGSVPAGGTQAAKGFKVRIDVAMGRILFTSERDGNNEIYVMSSDGSGQKNLTRHPASDSSASWSPDGSKIAFASNRDGNNEIYVMNADGSQVKRLTKNTSSETNVEWSPDGSKIAFASDRHGQFDVFVMNTDGTAQTRLTTDPGYDADMSWSPDGRRIAFRTMRARDGKQNSEIYVMNADGSRQTNISRSPAKDLDPRWSPDGTKIAFSSDRSDPDNDIYVMQPDGSGIKRLTSNPAADGDVTWSLDSRTIAFATKRSGNSEIASMIADPTGEANLKTVSLNPAVDRQPDW